MKNRWCLKQSLLILATLIFVGCSEGDPSPGDVVTKAETGYGNSLFESAEEKCQHCHYDLYETWADSMHAQSWTDPLFQVKFQARLSLLMTKKIGATGATGTISTKTAQKMAVICLNCHAPAAIYSKDYKMVIEEASSGDSNKNVAPSYDPAAPATIVGGVNSNTGLTYKATYQVGNPTNREGITCAFCHSIEAVNMMKSGDSYTLVSPIKSAPAIGSVLYPAGTTFHYNASSQNAGMNAFFQIVGPEFHKNYGDTSGSAKSRDGRMRMKSIPLNDDEAGATHYAGGPYYGPYGIYGTGNEADDDQTDRASLVDPNYAIPQNHFEDYGKAICLSCHQRSSKVLDPATGKKAFLELCTTWTVTDNNYYATSTSPKCQKCHMEKRKGLAVNAWYEEGKVPDDTSDWPTAMVDNANSQVFHSHQFEGGSSLAKLKAAFSTSVSASRSGNAINVSTTILNETAHMFPGAHPIRRALTMVRATDANGNLLALTGAAIATNWENTTYEYSTDQTASPVSVSMTAPRGNPPYSFTGQVTTPNGTVGSQWFRGGGSKRIHEDGATDRFVRIYGRETINAASGDVKPGYSANSSTDNRLLPNERETYSISFDGSGAAYPVTVKYVVYYMKKGASGNFPIGGDGFLDAEKNKANKMGIKGIYSKSITVE